MCSFCASAWVFAPGAQFTRGDDSIQHRLERIAQTNTHFSLTVIVNNRALRIWTSLEDEVRGDNPLAIAQLGLAKELRKLSGNREALSALLKNPDPRTRTLALGAIFQREDGPDLPLIAALMNDSAQTFPDLHNSMNSMGGPRPMSELENPLTVGHVAQAMLAFWGVAHDGRPVEMVFGGMITTNDFAEYWKKYERRERAASWFAIKMKRATRGTTPIHREYLPDIQRALAKIRTLPMPDRAWMQLYVLAPEGWFEFDPNDLVVKDAELIAWIKKIGPTSMLRFLQRQPVSADPDFLMDKETQSSSA